MRIAIVNDEPLSIKALELIVLSEVEHEVVWVAENGAEAIEMALKDTPDIILMDLYMPILDGVEATRQIMQKSPCAILVVTSCIDNHSGKVFDAMGAGALDAVNTPVLINTTNVNNSDAILHKLATINLLINPEKKCRINNKNKLKKQKQSGNKLLVIGASTGGPSALATILAELPADFPVPIIIVQHVDAQFVQGFSDWLNKQISLSVKLAKDGDSLDAGSVYIAGTSQHLVIDTAGLLQYQSEPSHYVHKPSVNVLFDSVVENWKGEAVGVLLTGMGKDGAVGLLAMRDHGFYTLTQDEESCAVYGMPKAAIQLDAAQVVLPLTEIASKLCQHFKISSHTRVVINE